MELIDPIEEKWAWEITSDRHILEAIENIQNGFNKNLSSDLIAIDIKQALHYLGEITGEVTSNEILDTIFSNFCVGK